MGSSGVLWGLALESGKDGGDIIIPLLRRVGFHSRLSGSGVIRGLALEGGEDGGDIVIPLLYSSLSRGGVLQYPRSVKMIWEKTANGTYFRVLSLEGSDDAGNVVVTATKTLGGFRVLQISSVSRPICFEVEEAVETSERCIPLGCSLAGRSRSR